ncbi:Lin-54-like protein [Auxenochlorella protothecoides]|uniref:Lin-54-like protein n=1 Tax=Auxenochlorella protothecoides TaxID=3075 RepID=A0A087SHD9_AUXPR|nr:Lin-54-like protein [Auxenochlorella protothecoides]KFM25143.1 Lin-54-like protein [Auxenochlorella protothecoides]
MALPQSPACVSLARGGRGTAGPALLPITQLRREGSGAEAAAVASLSRHLSAPAPPTERQSRLLDSPAAASGRSQGDRCSPDGTADGASEGMGEALSSLFPFPTGARKCNCKKSKCLKLYCDCFAGNGFCGPACTCVSCANREDNRGAVQQQREAILIRNPNAFDQKIAAVDVESGVQHRRGCNCKKSGCIKKYCECFQAGIACGEHCKDGSVAALAADTHLLLDTPLGPEGLLPAPL